MPHPMVADCGESEAIRRGRVTRNKPNCLALQQTADSYVLACGGRRLSELARDNAVR